MTVRYDSGMAGGFDFPIINPQRQFQIFEDFVGAQNFDTDETVTVTAATTGTIAKDITVHGGAVLLDAGAVTESQGVNVQFSDGIELDEAGDLFFECRVRFATTAGTSTLTDEMFIGLSESDTAIIASDAMSDTAFIGFSTCSEGNPATTDGYIQLAGNISTSGGTGSGAGATHIKIDTAANSGVGVDDFVRLGFVVRNGEAQAFVNGEKVGAKISNIPTSTVLLPSLVCQADGVRGKYIVDYFLVTSGRSSTAL